MAPGRSRHGTCRHSLIPKVRAELAGPRQMLESCPLPQGGMSPRGGQRTGSPLGGVAGAPSWPSGWAGGGASCTSDHVAGRGSDGDQGPARRWRAPPKHPLPVPQLLAAFYPTTPQLVKPPRLLPTASPIWSRSQPQAHWWVLRSRTCEQPGTWAPLSRAEALPRGFPARRQEAQHLGASRGQQGDRRVPAASAFAGGTRRRESGPGPEGLRGCRSRSVYIPRQGPPGHYGSIYSSCCRLAATPRGWSHPVLPHC